VIFWVEIAGIFENTDRFFCLIAFFSVENCDRPNNEDESAEKVINIYLF
jgi:hypothetical protein